MNYTIELTLANLLTIATVLFLIHLHLYKTKIKLDHLFYANVFLLFIALIEPSPSDLIFISLIIFSMKEKIISFEKYSKMRVLIWLILLYLIEASLSMINIKDYYSGFRFYGITLYLMVYSILVFFYINKENYITILRTYIISSTIAAGFGIIGYLGFFSDYLLFDAYRTKSLFKDPNVFGSFLIPSVILLLGDFGPKKLFSLEIESLKKIKIFKYINYKIVFNIMLIMINLTGIVISYSRGAWVSLVAGISVLILINLKQVDFKKFTIYLSATISIGLLFWYKIFNIETKKFFLERLNIMTYDSDRFAVQKIGITKALDHVLGYGPGQYEFVLKQIVGEEFSAHSLYVRIINENGIFGFILLILAFGYVIMKLFRMYKTDNTSHLSLLYFSISISLLINSLVIDTLHWRHLWLFYGLSLSYISDYQILNSNSITYLLIRNILGFVGMLFSCFKKQHPEILILMYHRVNDQVNAAIAVKEERFKWQMEYMKRGYKVISMDEAFEKIKEKTIDGKYIVLSFDDGYEDFYSTAYPVLKRCNYPAILYLVPGYIETDKVYAWDQDLGQSNLMNWEQIKKLKEDTLINIGSHTLNHYDINTLDSTTLRNELEESKKILEEKLETKITHFAYPKGIYDEDAKNALSEFYETGVLIYKGVTINNEIEPNEYLILKRIPVYRSDGKFMFVARLNGWIWLEEIIRRKKH